MPTLWATPTLNAFLKDAHSGFNRDIFLDFISLTYLRNDTSNLQEN